jgi:hypothetical protein
MSIWQWQRRIYLERCPVAMGHFDEIALNDSTGRVEDFERYSGLVECKVCGRQLYDHPPHPYIPCLTITCDGKLTKL